MHNVETFGMGAKARGKRASYPALKPARMARSRGAGLLISDNDASDNDCGFGG